MERKKWLEIFMRLVNTGARLVDYRRELRLFPPQVKIHLRKIEEYRQELIAIRNAEAKAEQMKEKLAHARAAKEAKRLRELEKKMKDKEDADRARKLESGLQEREKAQWEDDGGRQPDVESTNDNGKTLGTREDSVKDD
jgi:hypothetical protein